MPTSSYPSALFGYIAFTDPQTNERYVPITGYDANNHPVCLLLVDFSVQFSVAGSLVRAEYKNAQWGYGLQIKENDAQNPIALQYKIYLTPVRGDAPHLGLDSYRNLVLYFDPDVYTYDSIEITRTLLADSNGTVVMGDTKYTAIPAQPRPNAWADLADF